MIYRIRKEFWWVLVILILVLMFYQISAIREEQEWQRRQEVQMHYEADRDKWLIPYQQEIIELLNKL